MNSSILSLFVMLVIITTTSSSYFALLFINAQDTTATCLENPLTFQVNLGAQQTGTLVTSALTRQCPDLSFPNFTTSAPLSGSFTVQNNGNFVYQATDSDPAAAGNVITDNVVVAVICTLDKDIALCAQRVTFTVGLPTSMTTTTVGQCPEFRYECSLGNSITEQLSQGSGLPTCSQPLKFVKMSDASIGTVTSFNGDTGAFTYQAPAQAQGYANIQYSIQCNGALACSSNFISIYVTPTPEPTSSTTTTTHRASTLAPPTTTTTVTSTTVTTLSTKAPITNAPSSITNSPSSTPSPINVQTTTSPASTTPTTAGGTNPGGNAPNGNNNNNGGNNNQGDNKKDGGGGGAAVGIILGVVGGLILLGIGIMFYRAKTTPRAALDGEEFTDNSGVGVGVESSVNNEYRQFEVTNGGDDSKAEPLNKAGSGYSPVSYQASPKRDADEMSPRETASVGNLNRA